MKPSESGPHICLPLRRAAEKTASAVRSKWHPDEVFIKMNGVQHYLWRAVDQNGAVSDILVQPARDRCAALRFFRQLHATERPPRVLHHGQATELRRTETTDLAHRGSSAQPI